MNNLSAPARQLHKIVDDGMCLGCGLCASFAKGQQDNAIDFALAPDGSLRPFANQEITQDLAENIHRICPSTRIEGLPQPLIAAAPHKDLVWGPYHTLVTAYAGDAAIRHKGSTAGVLTALGCHLLQSGRVDFIAHACAPPLTAETPPHFGQATISHAPEQVIAAAGSRYGPTAPLINIMEALDQERPFALIAKPCDLNAMRNLAHLDPRVDRLIRYWLTPVCGGFMPHDGWLQFLARHNLSAEDVLQVRWRGYGCPGPTRLTLRNGEIREFDYLDVWGEDESQWSLHFRCKICPDGIGEGADIAAADTWEGGAPTKEQQQNDPGLNSLIVRTAAGAELLEAAVAAGWLALESSIDIEFLNRTQPHQVKKKRAAPARLAGLRQAGSTAPQPVNLRAEALAAATSTDNWAKEQQGAHRRALAARKQASPPASGSKP